jgi:protein-S-isoprenylcysteine O-methyltransferase Ste14
MLHHINPWNTVIILWQAICVLWIVTAVVEHSLPQPPDQRRDRYSYIYAIAMAPAAILTFWPATAIFPLNYPLYQSNTVGLILVFAGAAFAGLARLALGANWSARARIRAQHTLSTSGPYRIVRHPIYSGLLLLFLGTAVILGEARGYIAFVIAFLTWFFKSRTEDRLLAERFGPDFTAYRRRTKALIPGIL